jgi:thiol-disulfide isomerase/thioredoxin
MGALSALDGTAVWLNSDPLTAADLRGRAVLVDFWTYSCVNWLRTLPYVRAWHARYRDEGLVVVGAHAPEFGFEHDLEHVRGAVADLGIGYPVVIDNDFVIWRSFGNRYWPAVYLVDGAGRVRFRHFGEEAYAETERAIQGVLGLDGPLVDPVADGVALAAGWSALNSPETYLAGPHTGRRPEDLRLNEWTLAGAWTTGAEAALLEAGGGSIAYRFEARDVNLVLAADTDVGFTVRLDGEVPGDDRGLDADAEGHGTLSTPRMYQLARVRGPVRERTFEIAFAGPGVRAYVFTFG